MKGITKEGDTWKAGSFKIAQGLTSDASHNVYIIKNDELIGWIDVKDEVAPGSHDRSAIPSS